MALSLPLRESSSSGGRIASRRRAGLFGVLVLSLFLLLGYSTHSLGVFPLSAFGLAHIYEHAGAANVSAGRASRPLSVYAATRIQNQLNTKAKMWPRPTCEWTPWHQERYAPLKNTNRRVVFTMLLHDSNHLVSAWAQELPVVMEWLGVQNIFVSVYESGSGDRTAEYLRDCE